MIDLKIAKSEKEIVGIANLGFVIWQEHYTTIIGEEQVKYMLQKFQTVEAIAEQIEGGYEYYTIYYKDIRIGYFAFEQQIRTLFLSKMYILKEFRGKGIGKYCLNYLMQKGKKMGLASLSLTVNRYNENSIRFYKKYGFKKIDSHVMDIGEGFVMDDYIMEKEISVI